MSVGLDVGSSQIRCLRLRGEQTVGSSSRALFAVLPEASEYRALLEAGHIPFAICDGALALIGDNAAALALAGALDAQDLWVPAIRPPTVPVGTARLRITLSAAHTTDDVQRLIDGLTGAAATLTGDQP